MEHIDIHDVWALLPEEEQKWTCKALWEALKENPDAETRQSFMASICRQGERDGIRSNYFQKMSIEEKGEHTFHFIKQQSPSIVTKSFCVLLLNLYCTEKGGCYESFFKALGVDELPPNISGKKPPSAKKFRAVIQSVKSQSDRKTCCIIFWCILRTHDDLGQSDGAHYFRALPTAIKKEGFDLGDYIAENNNKPLEEEAAGQEQISGLEPDDDSFTPLDNLLITTIVESRLKIEGTIDSTQLGDIIDEFIHLNRSRQHTHYHLGFFQSLFDKGFDFNQPGLNESRRLWYFTGILHGLAREGKGSGCYQLLKQEKNLTKQLVKNKKVHCGKRLLPVLFDILIEVEDYPLAKAMTEAHFDDLSPNESQKIVLKIMGLVDKAVNKQDARFAQIMLSIFDNVYKDCEPHQEFASDLAVRKAQVLQLKGKFNNAEKLLAEETPTDPTRFETDLGLIKGKFKSIASIFPTKHQKRNTTLLNDLERGKKCFIKALGSHGGDKTSAHFSLGIIGLLKVVGSDSTAAEEAVEHFEQALTGLEEFENDHTTPCFTEWTKFGLGFCLLESLDPARLRQAHDLLEQSINTDVKFPLAFWVHCVTTASAYDDISIAIDVGRHLIKLRAAEFIPVLPETGLLKIKREFRKVFLDWLNDKSKCLMSSKKKWEHLEKLLPMCLEENTPESHSDAQEVLDSMEKMARKDADSPWIKPLLKILENPKSYEPAWDGEDAENARITCLELAGQHLEAADILQKKFHQKINLGEPYALAEAKMIIGRLEGYKLNEDIGLPSLKTKLADCEALPSQDTKPKDAKDIYLIYIGGNETQEKMVNDIKKRIAQSFPGIQVDLHLPGWSSNWNEELKKIVPKFANANAVILSYLVRTNLGRHVRKKCNRETPWFACTGKGRKMIETSISDAALWALNKRN